MTDIRPEAVEVDRWSEELRGPVPQLDVEAGFDVLDDFERFNQRNDIYSRSFWDPTVRSKRTEVFYETYRRPLKHFRNVDGFRQRDYSFRNASWHVPDVFAERKEAEDRREGFLDEYTALRDGAKESIAVESPADMASEIKGVARAFGANLVGVTSTDHRWTYTHKYSAQTQGIKPNDVLSGLDNVVVVATAMDYDLVQTVPSALSGAATGLGYTHDVSTVLALAQYIRNLGYRAVPSLNDTALAIPYALKAGLGEYGRHGLLITKAYGPRVRLGKVFTDLPLTHDRPQRFGVREFCEICRRCTNACPPKAIAGGAPSTETYNVSNIKGIRKWSVDAERCFSFWAGQNSDCSICIRVCPYNKDYTRLVHRLGRFLAGTPLRGLMLKLDVRLGYGGRKKAGWWWKKSRGD